MLIFTAALCERHKATEKSAKLNFQVKEVLLGKKKITVINMHTYQNPCADI